jgi:predicted ribosomally synthesized peptide with SipW-like signal peptide
MAAKRIRHVAAAVATVLLVPGGTPAALADTDVAAGPDRPAVRTERSAAERQRRVESAYLLEQHRAGRAATRRTTPSP